MLFKTEDGGGKAGFECRWRVGGAEWERTERSESCGSKGAEFPNFEKGMKTFTTCSTECA